MDDSINWQVRNSSLPFAIWRKKEREKEVQVKEMGEEKGRKERKGMEEGKCSSLKILM